MKRIQLKSGKDIPFILYSPALIWQVLFLLVPLGLTIFFSAVEWVDVSRFTVATWNNYAAVCNLVHARIILRSALLSLGTVFVTFLLAYPVAYFLALRLRRFKNVFLFLLTLPFWVNFLILVYAWLFLLEHNGVFNAGLMYLGFISQPLDIANNLIAVFIVMVYCYLPFIIMPIYTSLGKIDDRIFEASADLGAKPWQTFTRITLPLSFSGISTGLLLVMVPAFGELAIPLMVGGSKEMMVGSLISHYFFVVRDNGLGAAFTIVSGLVLVFLALSIHYSMRFLIRKFGKEGS